MVHRLATRLVLFVALVTWPRVASADDQTAERLFEEGQRLFEQGEVDAACDTFVRSLALVKTAGTLINLARCHAQQGKLALAWREYRQVEQLARGTGQEERARVAAELATALEPELARLRIELSQPASELQIVHNGEPWAAALGPAQHVTPGRQDIEATAAGSPAWRTSLDVAAGEEARVRIPNLAKPRSDRQPAPPPDDATSGLFVAGLTLGAAGLVATVAGGVLGGMTLNDVSEAESDDALCGADKTCTPKGLEHIDAAEKKGIAATVLLGVGVAGVVAGATLMILGYQDDPEAKIAAWGGADAVGLSWRQRF